jgi:Reverse transcriptase (RNA-dependent DNA polymerase)
MTLQAFSLRTNMVLCRVDSLFQTYNRIFFVRSEDDRIWFPVGFDSVYTDFSKAFDKVCHCLHYFKFTLSPIDPARCELLRSYLSGRIQNIRVVSCINNQIKVTSGESQGSPLGPLCFIWFFDEITLIFKYVRALFYADDMKLFLPFVSSHDFLRILGC